MQILLFILKVIGIILLILLGLIIFVVSLVLLVPVRYQISGEIEDEYKIQAQGVIRYLFSIFKMVIVYQNGKPEIDIFLFGIRKKKKALDESETEEVNRVIEENLEAETVSEPEKIVIKDEKPEEIQSEEVLTNKHTISSKKTIRTKKAKVSHGTNDEKKLSFEVIKRELTDKHNHSVLKKLLLEIKYLLSHFGFRKIETNLVFSTGDPAYTGQVLGILSMIPALYRYEIKLIPDFEADEIYLKGTFFIAGKIRLIHVLMVVLRLIFDKEVRLVVTKFKNQFV